MKSYKTFVTEKNWIKATKLHIRSEKKQGNKLVHPFHATLIGASLANMGHTAIEMARHSPTAGAVGVGIAAAMTHSLLGDHIKDIIKTKKHLDRVDRNQKKITEGKTYKVLITEIRRSPAHAQSILDKLSKSNNMLYRRKASNQIRNLIPEHPISGIISHPSNWGDGELRDVPMHKLYSDQYRVDKSVVTGKINKTIKRHSSPRVRVVHHVPSDTYHVADGNHRANEAKLKGNRFLKAVVLPSNQPIHGFDIKTFKQIKVHE